MELKATSIAPILGALLLTACAFATPMNISGNPAFLIECNGALNSLSTCIRKANSVCPYGYELAGGREQPQGIGSVIVTPGMGSVVQGVSRSIVVICNPEHEQEEQADDRYQPV